MRKIFFPAPENLLAVSLHVTVFRCVACVPDHPSPQPSLTTMKKFALIAASLLSLATGQAAQLIYTGVLSGAAEAPPNASPATGNVTVTIDTTLQTMRIQAMFSGLTGTSTAAHIHGRTSVPGAGTAGVITQVPSFVGFPLGVTSGSYDNTFDLTLASSFSPTYVTNNGGTVASARTAFLSALADGATYFNLHSSTFAGGEIRAFLVPEPSAALLALAAAPLFLRRRVR